MIHKLYNRYYTIDLIEQLIIDKNVINYINNFHKFISNYLLKRESSLLASCVSVPLLMN